MDANAVIHFSNVSFSYEKETVLHNLSFTLGDGEHVALVGASGTGKSTILHLIAGSRQPTDGVVYIRPDIIHSRALMVQSDGLLPWYTLRQNFNVALKIHGIARKEFQQRTEMWLGEFNIAHLADRFPSELSGGQRQRAALARTLALDVKLLLLDEPLTAIDELQRERMQAHLREVFSAAKATSVIVTHSIEEATLLADKIFVIKDSSPIESMKILSNPVPITDRHRSCPGFIEFTNEIRQELAL